MYALALSVEKPLMSLEGDLFRGVPLHLKPSQSSAEGLAMAEKMFQNVQVGVGSRKDSQLHQT